MDSFTERILERARERQKKLKQQGVIDDKQLDLKENQPSLVVSNADKIETLSNNSNQYNDRKESDIYESPRQNSLTKFSSDLPGSPQAQLKTLNIQKENFNMEIKLSSTDNIRVEVEIEERNDNDEVFKNAENITVIENKASDEIPPLREDTKKRLQRLGKLFSGGDESDISSPIHRTEEKFLAEDTGHNDDKENNQVKSTRRGLGKLAALANNINQWEDDITPHKKVSEKCVSPKKKPAISMQNTSKSGNIPVGDCPKPKVVTNYGSKDESVKETPKTVQWDQKESQGFTRTQSNSKLVYNYRETQERNKNDNQSKIKCISNNIIEPEKVENEMTPRSPKKTVTTKSAVVANKAALFELSPKNTKDPALLSVSERKALFEKNKGAAPLPKIPGMPIKMLKANPNMQSNKPNSMSDINKVGESVNNYQLKKVNEIVNNPSLNKEEKENTQSMSASPKKAEGIAKTMAALLENKTTISQQQIESSIKEQRQKEMDLLLNRFQQTKKVIQENETIIETMTDSDDNDDEEITEKTAMIKEQKKSEIVKRPTITPPPPPPLSESPRTKSPNKRISNSPKVAAVLEDVKRIKVVPPKEGRLYPCLSDIEAATETETEPQTASPTPNNRCDTFIDWCLFLFCLA
ncbi:anillin-like isoform X2 [Agrilus planipennis]|uniref:Anillin-like isoform X2 n=1 Tax=Agrilus planipennis TaxID=224129 RepID=A0A1W4XBQ2_AGRPL|nr:anillin-like isoform X2 [Agrilus planipennis]